MSANQLTERFALDGKVAAVIGGGGHICSALAQGLASAGCAVAVIDLRREKAHAVVEKISENYGTPTLSLACDATDKEQHRKTLSAIIESLGEVSILINGAGINDPSPFWEISQHQWQDVLNSHLVSTLFACQVFGKQMVSRGEGSIINISSASAGPPLSKAFAYSVAKAGIKNLTQNLAREWAPHGVRVNAIRPGFFPTEWNREHFIDEAREKAILSHTPMGRFGEPDELIGATLWLASKAASFVTGAEITVDGGFSCMTI